MYDRQQDLCGEQGCQPFHWAQYQTIFTIMPNRGYAMPNKSPQQKTIFIIQVYTYLHLHLHIGTNSNWMQIWLEAVFYGRTCSMKCINCIFTLKTEFSINARQISICQIAFATMPNYFHDNAKSGFRDTKQKPAPTEVNDGIHNSSIYILTFTSKYRHDR